MIQARTGVVRILLLEDSALDAELIEVQLAVAKLSFSIERVWTLDGFEEAVKSGRHDIILSDHLLLGFDGHDALKIARREAADLPFIFVSGTLSDELAVEALKQGARDFVVKQRLQRLPDAIVRALKENDESKKLAQAETELRRSREQLIVMADALPALIAHVGPDHRYRFGNDAHARWFGIAPDLLTGKHVADVVGEKAFKGAEGDLAKVLAGQRTVIEAVLLPNLEAPVRYAQIDCVPEIDASGRVAGYYMLAIHRRADGRHQPASKALAESSHPRPV